MADESTSRDEPEEARKPDGQDWLLAVLVRASNLGKGDFGITLWVGGLIVSGTACSVPDYFDGLAEEFKAAAGEGAAPMSELFDHLGQQARDEIAAHADDELPDDAPPALMIHLREARTYAPGGQPIPTDRGVWWRGRLDAVEGWCFGELAQT